MKKTVRSLGIVIAICLTTLDLKAQLITTTQYTPQYLVQNVLLGSGVNVSNVHYTGAPKAIGWFNGTNTNLGVDSGLVLTTGTVIDSSVLIPNFGWRQLGPFGPNNHGATGFDNYFPGDPLISSVVGLPSYNAARLEFDFVPQGDSITFEFVFGSEEYMEFVGLGVNDAFGFFISGPNPAGGTYTNRNIALIPNTTTPISINDLNLNSNGQYYINNPNINGSTDATRIQYDGFTTVLPANAAVVCGQTYHIVLVVSDIGDGILDSGVFLKANSFKSSSSLNITAENQSGNGAFLKEDCGEWKIILTRSSSDTQQEQTVAIHTKGSFSTQDVTPIPSQVVFQQGSDTVSFTLGALFDGVTEPLESIRIIAEMQSGCGTLMISDSVDLFIEDVAPLMVSLSDTTIFCPSNQLHLTPVVAGGSDPYTFVWNTAETTREIDVPATNDTHYVLTVTDQCGNKVSDTASIFVPPVIPIGLTLSADTTVFCANSLVTLQASSSGGSPNHHISWSTGTVGNTVTVNVTQTLFVVANATDQCGNSISDSVLITLKILPVESRISPDTIICAGESVNLAVVPSGGYGNNYSFSWNTGATDSVITVAPQQTETFIVGIADACGVIGVYDTVVVEVPVVEADFSTVGLMLENEEITFSNHSSGASSYAWNLGNGVLSAEKNPVATYPSPGKVPVTLIARNEMGCVDSISKVLEIRSKIQFYAPNSFTPDGDEHNNVWKPSVLGYDSQNVEILVFDRWGELVFESRDADAGWDGTYAGKTCPVGMYIWKATIRSYGSAETAEFNGHLNLIR
ncbi:choice-of-anchor L domain-containing protein [Fluviicola sp.]|uniref:choice-of-anchor L domain-containing protein n=1 Tax=Fluviicola sp. TaxID=1917219 RepID=UPI0031E29699